MAAYLAFFKVYETRRDRGAPAPDRVADPASQGIELQVLNETTNEPTNEPTSEPRTHS